MKKLVVLVLLFLTVQLPCVATTTYLGGIDMAIELAVQNSGELRATQARFGITEAQVFTANTRLNPVLITDNGIAEYTYRAGIQFIIETASKRRKRTLVAKAQHDVMQDEINIKILDIKSRVRKAYIALYAAQEKQRYALKIIETTNTLLNATQKKFQAGAIPQLDVIQIEIIKTNAENDLQNARLEIIRAHNELNLLLGHCLEQECELEAPALEHNFKDIAALTKEQHLENINALQKIALENRPELKKEQDNINYARRKLDLAKANRIPNLLIAGGPDMVTNTGNGSRTSAFILGAVDIPIFNRQQGPIKEAMAMEDASQKDLQYQKELILYQIKDSYSRIISNTKLLEKYQKELLPKSEEIVLKSRRSFEEGKDDIVVPLLAQEAAIKVQFAYIRAVSEYQTAISDLERAIGTYL